MLPVLTSLANGSSSHDSPPDTPPAGCKFKFGVPGDEFLEFEGPGGPGLAAGEATWMQQVMSGEVRRRCEDFCGAAEYRRAFDAAVRRMQELGGELTRVDFAPFCEVAALLYSSAFVAERYAGIKAFLEAARVSMATAVGPLSEVFSHLTAPDGVRLGAGQLKRGAPG